LLLLCDLYSEKIDSIKRAMLSLNIKPRPGVGKLTIPSLELIFPPPLSTERIVSAVIAARPRLGDEEGFFVQSPETSSPALSSSLPPAPPDSAEVLAADFADFGEHFKSPIGEPEGQGEESKSQQDPFPPSLS
jgi:hypothetical protein